MSNMQKMHTAQRYIKDGAKAMSTPEEKKELG